MSRKTTSAGPPAGRARTPALLLGLPLLLAAPDPARAADPAGAAPAPLAPELGRPAAPPALAPAATLATPAALATSVPSRLAWRSGATGGGFPCLAQLRGRPLDALTTFITHASFPAMVAQTGGAWARGTARQAPLWVVSLPLLTDNTRGQFAQCAAGAFDGYFRQIGGNLRAAGAQGTVVRLGWEANIGSHGHPWGYDRLDQLPAYRGCFRHAALALKAGGPGLAVEWTNAQRGQAPFNVLYANPGDDVVDLWGVHYYDKGPEKSTSAIWWAYWGKTWRGGPWGLGSWLANAAAHGKKLGIAEWGVVAADDPYYVFAMFYTFYRNAPYIAYETYFDAM